MSNENKTKLKKFPFYSTSKAIYCKALSILKSIFKKTALKKIN